MSRCGPSPLARGKRCAGAVRQATAGTIPARAGETTSIRSRKRGHGDHPRSRGGNGGSLGGHAATQGPSPLARGKPAVWNGMWIMLGTIPARAGETLCSPDSIAARRDHPRSRGGNAAHGRRGICIRGPSPLARGKHKRAARSRPMTGTIPARAGETPDAAASS